MYGKNARPFGTQISIIEDNYFEARRSRLGWSRAKLLGQIVDFYFALGAPPLCDIESGVTPIPIPEECRVPMRDYWAHLTSPQSSSARAESARIASGENAVAASAKKSNHAKPARTRNAR